MLPTHRRPTHPGEMLLKEFLEPLDVSQIEAARRMNIPFQRLNAIIKGRLARLVIRAHCPFALPTHHHPTESHSSHCRGHDKEDH